MNTIPKLKSASDTRALLLIDLINPFNYDGAAELFEQTCNLIQPIASLRDRARQLGVPVIFVNDNFGRWRSDFKELVAQCESGMGKNMTRAFRPADDDFFVLKPQRSGFYCTPLHLLLQNLGARHLILAGIATEMCLTATAHDACMRGYRCIVPRNTTASFSEARRDHALDVLEAANAITVGSLPGW